MRASEVTASAVLRLARPRAGLTQRELAQRAGVSQSVIAAYEGESREPSLATLAALVASAGISMDPCPSIPADPVARPPPSGRGVWLARPPTPSWPSASQ